MGKNYRIGHGCIDKSGSAIVIYLCSIGKEIFFAAPSGTSRFVMTTVNDYSRTIDLLGF